MENDPTHTGWREILKVPSGCCWAGVLSVSGIASYLPFISWVQVRKWCGPNNLGFGIPACNIIFWNIWHWGAPAVQHRRQWNELIPPGFQKFSRSLGKSVHVLEDMCGWVFGLQNRGEDGFGVAVRRIGAPSRASWIRHPTWSWTKGRLETERPGLPTRYTHY